MFLPQLEKRNPELIDFALELHRDGKILPDTYVIDLDAVAANTRSIVNAANERQIELLYMTKQMGRNPIFAKTVQDAGIKDAVVVDYREAEIFMENGLSLGNVGHLVQVPHQMMKKILRYGTKYVTVYSLENVEAVNQAAHELGISQKIILKVMSQDDDIYPGQVGGFTVEQLEAQIPTLLKLQNIEIVGLATFPAILFDPDKKSFAPTANVRTVMKAKRLLNKMGVETSVLSLPSATATNSIPLIHELGGTEAEPGHALTGTTPFHAISDQPEMPAYCYVSEVSHSYLGHSYVYGGGLYRRGHLSHALIGTDNGMSHAHVLPLESTNIDYYLELDQQFKAGSPVIMAFRTQIFVTRSTVALVRGLHSKSEPKLVGLFDSLGKELPEGME